MALLHSAEFWVAVAFVIFVVLASRPVWRPIAKALDERGARIRAQLDEARRLREEAQRLLADYQKKQREASKEAEDIIAHAHDEAARLKQEAAANLEAAIARRERMAMDKIAQAEAQAIAEVRNEAVDIAVAATRRLLGELVDAPRAAVIVDASIAELDRKLH